MVEKILYGVVVAMGITIVGMWIDNTRLEGKVNSLNVDLVVSKTNELTLGSVIKKQNDAISEFEVDKAKREQEYTELLSQPEKVRFEKVYVKVPSIEVKSDECKDIKKLIDDIRNAGY